MSVIIQIGIFLIGIIIILLSTHFWKNSNIKRSDLSELTRFLLLPLIGYIALIVLTIEVSEVSIQQNPVLTEDGKSSFAFCHNKCANIPDKIEYQRNVYLFEQASMTLKKITYWISIDIADPVKLFSDEKIKFGDDPLSSKEFMNQLDPLVEAPLTKWEQQEKSYGKNSEKTYAHLIDFDDPFLAEQVEKFNAMVELVFPYENYGLKITATKFRIE
jgi:hypothetical protein